MKNFTKIIERFEQNIIRDGQAKPDDLNNITLLYETFTKWSIFIKKMI